MAVGAGAAHRRRHGRRLPGATAGSRAAKSTGCGRCCPTSPRGAELGRTESPRGPDGPTWPRRRWVWCSAWRSAPPRSPRSAAGRRQAGVVMNIVHPRPPATADRRPPSPDRALRRVDGHRPRRVGAHLHRGLIVTGNNEVDVYCRWRQHRDTAARIATERGWDDVGRHLAAIDAERGQFQKWGGAHPWGHGDCSSPAVDDIVKTAVIVRRMRRSRPRRARQRRPITHRTNPGCRRRGCLAGEPVSDYASFLQQNAADSAGGFEPRYSRLPVRVSALHGRLGDPSRPWRVVRGLRHGSKDSDGVGVGAERPTSTPANPCYRHAVGRRFPD